MEELFCRTDAFRATTVASSIIGSGFGAHETTNKTSHRRCRRWKFTVNYISELGAVGGSVTIPTMPDAPDFETALKRLEEIVKKLETGDQPLDNALELFEEGIKLSRLCHSKLEQAERRVEILLKSGSGQVQAVPFDHEDSEK